MTEQARTVFEDVRNAFLLVEAAHRAGRPGIDEKAVFMAKVATFRQAAAAIHRVNRGLRGKLPGESVGSANRFGLGSKRG